MDLISDFVFASENVLVRMEVWLIVTDLSLLLGLSEPHV